MLVVATAQSLTTAGLIWRARHRCQRSERAKSLLHREAGTGQEAIFALSNGYAADGELGASKRNLAPPASPTPAPPNSASTGLRTAPPPRCGTWVWISMGSSAQQARTTCRASCPDGFRHLVLTHPGTEPSMRFLSVGSHLCAWASSRHPFAGLPLPSASSSIGPKGHYRYSYRGLSPHQFMPMPDVHDKFDGLLSTATQPPVPEY